MTFNSYEFILVFLPVFVLVYLVSGLLPLAVSKIVIIAGGIVFYAFAGRDALIVLGISILVNYIFALLILKTRFQKAFLVFDILFNAGLLFFFKYLGFVTASILGKPLNNSGVQDIFLPLGISFFTFQQIMYVVSVKRGETTTGLIDYLAYILYFPKLVMGPLMEPSDFFAQLNDEGRKRPNWANLAGGLKVFSFGFFKKMVLADTFAKAVAWGFQNGVTIGNKAPSATAGDLFLVMLFYTFQIYFDFSGYTDMATGISKMINIDLPMNFDSPYKAVSIRDFWKRWHISLTGFFTKYVYYPLGGNRKGRARTYANIMIVFLLSGIWHGANWTFILWGFLHGALQIVERIFRKWLSRLSEVVRWGGTFLAVNLLWLLFRADSIAGWREMLGTMFRFQNMSISGGLLRAFEIPERIFIFEKLHITGINADVRGLSMLLFTVLASLICLIPENNCRRINRTNTANMIFSAAAFVWAFLCLSSESVFVYFNF